MSANNTDDLSISQAIEILEERVAEIRKDVPKYSEFTMLVPEKGDLDLLSEFIAEVNEGLGVKGLQRMELKALSAEGFRDWFAWFTTAVPFAVAWGAVKKYCGASRCSLKVRLPDQSEIDVSAATPEEAERLFKCASRIVITKQREP